MHLLQTQSRLAVSVETLNRLGITPSVPDAITKKITVKYGDEPLRLCYLYIREQGKKAPLDSDAFLVFNINPKSITIEQGVRVGVQHGRNAYTVTEGGLAEPRFKLEGSFGWILSRGIKPADLGGEAKAPLRDGWQMWHAMGELIKRYLDTNQERLAAGLPLHELMWVDPLHGSTGKPDLKWVVTPAAMPSLVHEYERQALHPYKLELIGIRDEYADDADAIKPPVLSKYTAPVVTQKPAAPIAPIKPIDPQRVFTIAPAITPPPLTKPITPYQDGDNDPNYQDKPLKPYEDQPIPGSEESAGTLPGDPIGDQYQYQDGGNAQASVDGGDGAGAQETPAKPYEFRRSLLALELAKATLLQSFQKNAKLGGLVKVVPPLPQQLLPAANHLVSYMIARPKVFPLLSLFTNKAVGEKASSHIALFRFVDKGKTRFRLANAVPQQDAEANKLVAAYLVQLKALQRTYIEPALLKRQTPWSKK